MTPSQKEVAARELCRLRGVDPDLLVAHAAEPNHRSYFADVLLRSLAWALALDEVRARELLDAAMDAGRASCP